jgi:hypothetical protein
MQTIILFWFITQTSESVTNGMRIVLSLLSVIVADSFASFSRRQQQTFCSSDVMNKFPSVVLVLLFINLEAVDSDS